MTFFDDTNELALSLNEDLSGANGDLAGSTIFARLVESIREAADIRDDDTIPSAPLRNFYWQCITTCTVTTSI